MSTGVVVGIVIGLVLALVLGSWALKRRREAARRLAEQARQDRVAAAHVQNVDPLAQDASAGGDPRDLKPGDIVELLNDGQSYVVRGGLSFREGPYAWQEFFLDTGLGTKRYLSVEEDEGDLSVALWMGEPDSGLNPGPKELTYLGVTYRLAEHGHASYSSRGTTGLPARGAVEYYDYKNKSTNGNYDYLSFERFDGGAWEVSRGEDVPETFWTIYAK